MSSILETFYILFKTNASEVKKGTQQAGTAVDEFEAKIKNSDKATQLLAGSFGHLIGQAVAAAGAIAGIHALVSQTFKASDFARELGETAKGLGVSITTLGAWSDAVKHIGGTAESAQESFKTLSGSLAQIDATGHSRVKPFFDELGIQLEDSKGKIKPVNDLLLELAGKFETMDKQKSYGFGRKLQLDDATIRLLQQGRSSVEELLETQKKLSSVTDEDSEAGKKWYETLDDLENASRGVFLSIAKDLLPILEDLAKWFVDNKSTIGGVLEVMATGIALITTRIVALFAVAQFKLLVGGIMEVVAWVGLLSDAFATGAVAEWALMAPWTLIAAVAIGAIILIYEKWSWLVNEFKEGVVSIKNAFQDVGEFFGFGKAVHEVVNKGQIAVLGAASSPLTSQPSNAFTESKNITNTITVGDINVHSNASDPAEVAKHVYDSIMQPQLRQATNGSLDGVKM